MKQRKESERVEEDQRELERIRSKGRRSEGYGRIGEERS